MEILKTNRQGCSKVTGSIVICYNIMESNGSVRELMGSIQKDAVNLGTVTIYDGGRVVLYFDDANGLTYKEQKAVFGKAMDDAETIFKSE